MCGACELCASVSGPTAQATVEASEGNACGTISTPLRRLLLSLTEGSIAVNHTKRLYRAAGGGEDRW